VSAVYPVVIIGSGVAGLSAASHLAERGIQPMILEAHPAFAGGRLRGGPDVRFTHQGKEWSFPGEHGVHGIWQPYQNLKQLLQRHDLLPDLWPSPNEAWIHIEGSRVKRSAIGNAIHQSPFPAPLHYLHLFSRWQFLNMLGPADLLALPRVVGTLFVALGIDPIGEQNPLRGETLATFTKGWSPRLRSFFAGLARNALAAHPEEAQAAGFIAFLRFYTISRRDTWAFSFLPGTGATAIIDPLITRLTSLGAQLRLGASVTQIEYKDNQWHVTYDQHGQIDSLTCEQLILALDAPACARLLRNSPGTRPQAEHLWFPQGAPTAIFRIWFAQQPRTPASTGIMTGDVTVDNFFWLHHFQPAYREWAAATGGSALEMHIYGPPEVLAQPDEVLLAHAIRDANQAFPQAGAILHSELIRNPATHTIFGVAEAPKHLGVATPWNNLYACGDWVAHPSQSMYLERATTTGIAAANAVLAARTLEPWPIQAYPPPEPLAQAIARWIYWLRYTVRKRRKRTATPDSLAK
jgi:carotenoid phi-ring synthase / carotenoid chi-ring synthase